MTEIQQRVCQCFSNVFPDLPPGDMPRTSVASLARWDSVAHVTLLSAIAEEFALEISPDEFEELTSWALIVNYLENHQAYE